MKSENESPLERYFRALESIAISPHGLSVSEIAQTCDLPVGTAHRLLQNLQRSGLIATNGEKRKDYRLGERLLRLLHAGSDGAWLSIAVQPILNDLANRLEETCYLARLAGHEIVSTAWATPNSGLRGYVVPGYRMSPHVAASAKAILAFQSPELIDKALTEPLPKLTKNTKTDRASIDREYAQVRKQGYATCWDEMEIGLGAIAVPISLPDTGVIYSVGIAGLIDRLTRRSEQDSVALLQSSVEMLSRALRDLGPPEHIGSQDNRYRKRS
ncbi:MAG: IclR family transcriptional regulator [Rhizobiales bacterium]|nr:IclR family transcriptional regulator [Hyphomicrobiales bacterium]